MRVLITGGAGFIGQALLRALVSRGKLVDSDDTPLPISEVVLADRFETGASLTAPFSVTPQIGDPADEHFVKHLCSLAFDTVFDLAASLTLDAEKNPAAAYVTNVESVRRLITESPKPTKLIFASSIAASSGCTNAQWISHAVGVRQNCCNR
jgi:D-erythronate 2-dehydrogenase